MTFSISSQLSSLDLYRPSTASRADMGLSGLIPGLIWKRSCINLYISGCICLYSSLIYDLLYSRGFNLWSTFKIPNITSVMAPYLGIYGHISIITCLNVACSEHRKLWIEGRLRLKKNRRSVSSLQTRNEYRKQSIGDLIPVSELGEVFSSSINCREQKIFIVKKTKHIWDDNTHQSVVFIH